MGFHNAVYPLKVQFRSIVGAGFQSAISQTDSGGLHVNQNWSDPLRLYDLSQAVLTPYDIELFRSFYFARGGASNVWLLKDPTDFSSSFDLTETDIEKRRPRRATPGPLDVSLGQYEGSPVFQLKTFYADQGIFRERVITKPIPGSVRVAVNGQELPDTVFTVDYVTGEVSIAWVLLPGPPAVGSIVSAGFLYYVPVRFTEDTDESFSDSLDGVNRENFTIQAIEDREDIFLPSEPLFGGTKRWGPETQADPVLQPALGLTHILAEDFPAGVNARLPNTNDWRTGQVMRVWNLSPFPRQLIAPDTTSVVIPPTGLAQVDLFDTKTGGQRWISIVNG